MSNIDKLRDIINATIDGDASGQVRAIKRAVDYSQWCRNLMASLNDGGKWGIPRSGLIFTKRGEKLILTDLLPHDPVMPITKEQLEEAQNDDYEATKENFEAAGFTVEKEVSSEPREVAGSDS